MLTADYPDVLCFPICGKADLLITAENRTEARGTLKTISELFNLYQPVQEEDAELLDSD